MKKAVVYGAGNIGRGFIGQLFSQSGYEVVFLDINPVIIERLNSDHCYPIKIIGDGIDKEIIVENVRGLNAIDPDSAADEIANADIMASAVGVNVLPRIVKTIAVGLKKRWRNENFQPFNIIICENLLDANHFIENLIKQELNDKEQKYFDMTVGLVRASVGRMVPVMTAEALQGNPLRICVEEYCELPVDKDSFKGEIPQIVNMKPVSPFGIYIHKKLFMHNMAHSLMAYLGFREGMQKIWETCGNPYIKLIALRALVEASEALSEEYGVLLRTLIEHSEDLLYRFGNKQLGDTVERVGKDPVRKLSKSDRLIGLGLLCEKHGIKPVYISIGIAAGFLFNPLGDYMADRVQKSLSKDGVENAVKEICGLDLSDIMFRMIVEFYNLLRSNVELGQILKIAEKMKIQYSRKELAVERR